MEIIETIYSNLLLFFKLSETKHWSQVKGRYKEVIELFIVKLLVHQDSTWKTNGTKDKVSDGFHIFRAENPQKASNTLVSY